MSIAESKKQMNSVDRREQESMIYHHHHKGYLSVTLEPRGPKIAARSSSRLMPTVEMPSTAVIMSPLEQEG